MIIRMGIKKEFLEDPALANLEAVKNNHVCYLKDKNLYTSNQTAYGRLRRLPILLMEIYLLMKRKFFLRDISK